MNECRDHKKKTQISATTTVRRHTHTYIHIDNRQRRSQQQFEKGSPVPLSGLLQFSHAAHTTSRTHTKRQLRSLSHDARSLALSLCLRSHRLRSETYLRVATRAAPARTHLCSSIAWVCECVAVATSSSSLACSITNRTAHVPVCVFQAVNSNSRPAIFLVFVFAMHLLLFTIWHLLITYWKHLSNVFAYRILTFMEMECALLSFPLSLFPSYSNKRRRQTDKSAERKRVLVERQRVRESTKDTEREAESGRKRDRESAK